MKSRSYIAVTLFIFPVAVRAFNKQTCFDSKNVAATILGVSTSSGQFTSSTGGCAAIGMNSKKEEILQYVSVNSDSLQKDLARKSGEYLSALQFLADLNDYQKSKLANSPQAQEMLLAGNYEQFYQILLTL